MMKKFFLVKKWNNFKFLLKQGDGENAKKETGGSGQSKTKGPFPLQALA